MNNVTKYQTTLPYWITNDEDKPSMEAFVRYVERMIDIEQILATIKVNMIDLQNIIAQTNIGDMNYLCVRHENRNYYYYTIRRKLISGKTYQYEMKIDMWGTYGVQFLDRLLMKQDLQVYVERAHYRTPQTQIQIVDPLYEEQEVTYQDMQVRYLKSWTVSDGGKKWTKGKYDFELFNILGQQMNNVDFAPNWNKYAVFNDIFDFGNGVKVRSYLCVPIFSDRGLLVRATYNYGGGVNPTRWFLEGNTDYNVDNLIQQKSTNFLGIYYLPHPLNFNDEGVIDVNTYDNKSTLIIQIPFNGLEIRTNNLFSIHLEPRWWKLNNPNTINTLSILNKYHAAMNSKKINIQNMMSFNQQENKYEFNLNGWFMLNAGGILMKYNNNTPSRENVIEYGGNLPTFDKSYNDFIKAAKPTLSAGIAGSLYTVAGGIGAAWMGRPLIGAAGVIGGTMGLAKQIAQVESKKIAHPQKPIPAYLDDVVWEGYRNTNKGGGEPVEIGEIDQQSLMHLNNLYVKYGSLLNKRLLLKDIVYNINGNTHNYIKLDGDSLIGENEWAINTLEYELNVVEYLKRTFSNGIRIWNKEFNTYEEY